MRRDILLKSTPTLRSRLRDHAIAVHTASEKAAKDSRAALAHHIRLVWASGNMAEFHRLANEEPWTK